MLFVYVVSLASNEKFELNYEELIIIFSIVFITLTLTIINSFFYKSFDFSIFNIVDQNIIIFSEEIINLIILIIAYLLFTLIVAVKISSKYEGPLRNFI